MNGWRRRWCALVASAAVAACTGAEGPAAGADGEAFERGPNGGRVLRDGDFALELAIFERGVSPEWRAWPSEAGRAVDPRDVELTVRTTRLGGRVDTFPFHPEDGFLRGEGVVAEPHSFEVAVEAAHAGARSRWAYETFEGRTRIAPEVAARFGLATELAGPAVLRETLIVYGRIVPMPERVSEVAARFDGTLTAVTVTVGDRVQAGERLATVESNDSLQRYDVTAPIAGVIAERAANPGEQTRGRRLFTIVDPAAVWAELAVFPGDRPKVAAGASVTVIAPDGTRAHGTIAQIGVVADLGQAVTARVPLDNPAGALVPGTFVTAEVLVAEHEVALAVRRDALQTFRDQPVVYAQVGDVYEVRMLELGREDGTFAEVLGGLEPGTRYVTEGSYVVKADAEKSGAAHDH